MKEYLREFLKRMELELGDEQLEQSECFYRMMIERNKSVNLTAVTDERESALKHFADSLSVLTLPDFKRNATLIDVGTGAGFPALPLKIACPELKVTAVDALRKRLDFIAEVIDALGLKDISLKHARAEDAARDTQFREKFDYATARAVASMNVLCEYTLPFVSVGGSLIAYKGPSGAEEMKNAKNAIAKLGGVDGGTCFVEIGSDEITRCLCIVKKTAHTPSQFPRKAGIPEKKPL